MGGWIQSTLGLTANQFTEGESTQTMRCWLKHLCQGGIRAVDTTLSNHVLKMISVKKGNKMEMRSVCARVTKSVHWRGIVVVQRQGDVRFRSQGGMWSLKLHHNGCQSIFCSLREVHGRCPLWLLKVRGQLE